jgi:hypothetical protein
VADLTCLKLWTEAIETGDLTTAAAYGGGFDRWARHLRDVTRPMVQDISRVCMAGGMPMHVDMSTPRRPGPEQPHRPEPRIRGHSPSLPGRPRVVRPFRPRGIP